MGSKIIVNNYGSFDITFKSGKGAVVKDVNGKKYIDFLAGIAVNCLGHNYAPLVRAIRKQAGRQIHICNYFTSDVGNAYAEALMKATGFDGVYFGNSGAEANEAAIKLARKYGQLNGGSARKTIVTLEHSFHGRTLATLRATGQDKFHPDCFAPYPDGFKTIKANDYDALKTAFDSSTAALMMECVQGEGGVILIDPKWAQAAAKAARDAGAIVIADEVQTGMGRTGSLLASEQLQFNPEVVTLAKGIAGGVPMGACLFRGKAAGVFQAGDHQSTFGGNPLACAAAHVVLKKLTSPDFLEHVTEKGEYMREVIRSWGLPVIKDVRGLGLMTGVQVDGDPVAYEKAALDAGLLFSTAGTDTLRLVPPLNISQKQIDAGLGILRSVLEK
ncbi:MAG: acetylornithine/succinylornithine family transaminase [Treponema sp.]|jgi:acetylornithine/N-succinyldiaminopimelate aminotransferase|nr:acetylornithine/succinylornithine family transaminase [Treponema sp.]